jgi:hypothetical protein
MLVMRWREVLPRTLARGSTSRHLSCGFHPLSFKNIAAGRRVEPAE